MRISFSDFGPIATGTIELKPLTILIGPNQAGKSFAAEAAYAFLRALRAPKRFRWYFAEGTPYPPLFDEPRFAWRGVSENALEVFRDKVVASDTNHPLTVGPDDLSLLESLSGHSLYKSAIAVSFRDTFSTEPRELARHGGGAPQVILEATGESGSEEQFEIKLDLRSNTVKTSFDLDRLGPIRVGYVDRRRKDYAEHADGIQVLFQPKDREAHKHPRSLAVQLAGKLAGSLPRVAPGRVSQVLYVPAIRSGLLLSHRLFLSLLVRNVSRVGIEPLSVPQMTGVIADFLQALLNLPDATTSEPGEAPSQLRKVITEAEQLIAGGTVFFDRSDHKDVIPNLRYKTDRFELPLNLTSSAVTEVAPLFLLLRTISQKNAWVIIEEPEAHLSPENQRHMAGFLVRLVKSGVRLLVTTHSTFLMEQINNSIAAASSAAATTAAISPTAVAAYEFVQSEDRSGGTSIRSLPTDPATGIDMEAFTRTYESIYEEGFAIRRQQNSQ